jgi:hypothetical protein
MTDAHHDLAEFTETDVAEPTPTEVIESSTEPPPQETKDLLTENIFHDSEAVPVDAADVATTLDDQITVEESEAETTPAEPIPEETTRPEEKTVEEHVDMTAQAEKGMHLDIYAHFHSSRRNSCGDRYLFCRNHNGRTAGSCSRIESSRCR